MTQETGKSKLAVRNVMLIRTEVFADKAALPPGRPNRIWCGG